MGFFVALAVLVFNVLMAIPLFGVAIALWSDAGYGTTPDAVAPSVFAASTAGLAAIGALLGAGFAWWLRPRRPRAS